MDDIATVVDDLRAGRKYLAGKPGHAGVYLWRNPEYTQLPHPPVLMRAEELIEVINGLLAEPAPEGKEPEDGIRRIENGYIWFNAAELNAVGSDAARIRILEERHPSVVARWGRIFAAESMATLTTRAGRGYYLYQRDEYVADRLEHPRRIHDWRWYTDLSDGAAVIEWYTFPRLAEFRA